MTTPLRSLTTRLGALLAGLRPAVVQAHCDTDDGPAAADGRRALETGDLNHALPWIPADVEAELRDVFERALRVRTLGPDAAAVADRLFLETLVRLHRMGEGVGFTGLKPAGTHPALVAAADGALAAGCDAALLPLVPEARRSELHRRFETAVALREHELADVDAGRRALAAYVAFVTYAEGAEHEHDGVDDGPARGGEDALAQAHAHAHEHADVHAHAH